MKTTVLFMLISLICFSLAACATPEQTIAAVTAVGASAAEIVNAVAPMLPPETLAKLQLAASHVDGTVEATATAVSTIADAFARMKNNVGAQFVTQTEGLNKAVQQLQALPTREELYYTAGGTATAGTAASRLLSRLKHSKPA